MFTIAFYQGFIIFINVIIELSPTPSEAEKEEDDEKDEFCKF